MAASVAQLENGYRLANERFEADLAFPGPIIGITNLAARGEPGRQSVSFKESPLTLRLATDAQRIDIISWDGHAGSGNPVPPEADWGYELGLHKKPAGGGSVQRLTDLPVGPPFYTDTLYPGYFWYRTMITLPKEWRGKPVVFVLGGCDDYDWRSYWVYVNGERIGQSSHDPTYVGPWHETPRYVLKPTNVAYAMLKFGEPNQLSVQARGLDRRTPEMNHRDIERYSGQSLLVDQYVAGGEPTEDVTGFKVVEHRSSVADGVAAVELDFTHPFKPISMTARYWLNPDETSIHKSITVRNEGNAPITLLEADVLSVDLAKTPVSGGRQGWPCRIGDDWFAGVCHPAGVARRTLTKEGATGVRLQVIPGATLDPMHDHDYASKTAVIGVGDGARAFADYLQAHGRRKPQFLNMYSLYGLCEIATSLFAKIELTEPLVMQSARRMRELQGRGIKFDYYCIDTGWNDPVGDLKTFHPANFPNGPDQALKAVRDLDIKPLLWISPAAGPAVFRGGVANPLVPPGGEDNVGVWGMYCLRSDKWRSILRDAMLHHVKQNGVRGFKLDEVTFYCGRSSHGHLPNKHGVENQMDAFIDTLDAVKKECPDLLLMLYWRFMSPWWLLHADTIYERGLLMEGATPSTLPSRLIRQSVTMSLDQGHDYNWNRMPLIGQDSLGVWLSNTRWGSWMGAEGWREAWVMDFIRGNMMHQLWGDLSFLNDEDLNFMETIARCTRENTEVLKHPRRILGSPWRQEPYGYACCEGDRGLIAIHNAQFPADRVRVALNESIGLSSTKSYEVRWIYKDGSIAPQTQIVNGALDVELGSFEVCLAQITATKSAVTPAPTKPARSGPRKTSARLLQTSCTPLNWSDPRASKRLAMVVNGRTTPTNTPETLAIGPDRSDERDRDIVQENSAGTIALEKYDGASKLIVIASFDREGIAWHHLAPFLITQITATAGSETLKAKTTPRKMHEQAGGWSWVLHEFDVPPGTREITLSVDAVHPRTVAVSLEIWHSDE